MKEVCNPVRQGNFDFEKCVRASEKFKLLWSWKLYTDG